MSITRIIRIQHSSDDRPDIWYKYHEGLILLALEASERKIIERFEIIVLCRNRVIQLFIRNDIHKIQVEIEQDDNMGLDVFTGKIEGVDDIEIICEVEHGKENKQIEEFYEYMQVVFDELEEFTKEN